MTNREAEAGKISEALADAQDENLKTKIEELIRELNFRPFVYQNEPRKMRGYVYYSQLPLNN
jgi:Txe/YoeB family toxin of Txe-Axe toxin-antitoxin module